MADTDSSRWQLSKKESKDGFIAVLQTASNLVAPGWGPLLVWGGSIVFERRHELFNIRRKPFQTINFEGERLELTGTGRDIDGIPLTDKLSQKREIISFTTDLTKSARKAGLRRGDPVSVVIGNRDFTSTKSGLVVPARIGESVDVTVPRGDYSLAAFGSKSELLFAARNPYSAIGGSNISQAKRQEVELLLSDRDSILSPTQPPPSFPCLWCGNSYVFIFAHFSVCPGRPLLISCDKCDEQFPKRKALKKHQAAAHPAILDSSHVCPLCKQNIIFDYFGHADSCLMGTFSQMRKG